MGHRRLGRDAVAEIEDQRTSAQRLKDGIHALFQSLAADNEPERVEIALYGSPGLQALRLAQRTISATGLTQQASKVASSSTPDQESNICTTSAPASIWRMR